MHVVFGAGPLGLAVARELVARGRRVRVATRTGRAPVPRGIDVVAADATDPASARMTCRDAAVVYHCASVPYHQWPVKLAPIMVGILEGAASVGARIVYGDNLYMYGPVDGPLTEALPYRAAGPNGRTRAAVATMLMEAHAGGRVRAAIGRAADYFGPHVRQSTVGDRVFIPLLSGRAAQVLGNPDLPHTYTFIDDFARGLVTLGERNESLGQIWHVPSADTLTTRGFVALICQEAGLPFRMRVAPEWGIALLALFNPTLRAVREQQYQRTKPFVVDHGKFARVFGANPTPHRAAIRQTLDWYRAQVSARLEER